MTLTRRGFLAAATATAASLAAPAFAAATPHVVIVGGGAGGATAAGFIRRLAGDRVRVTLVEPSATYITCFFSNWVIGGLRTMADITHDYTRLPASGIAVVQARASRIDRDARSVVLDDGTAIAYDRLILSPGIDLRYDALSGYTEAASEIMPHAWKAGPQTELLKRRLDAVKDGGSIVMLAPANPYRCPPGPYERVSLMAHVLKSTGRTKARITVLDAKEKFSKQALFQEAWEQLYPGMVEWLPPSVHGGVERVDPAGSSVVAGLDTFKADLVNVIPPQHAGAIARTSDLAKDGWCPVDAASMRSALDANIFVIGDAASAGEMPKSAFSANSQAKVAGANVLADLLDWPRPDPRFFNTCWSLLGPDDGVKVGALYAPKDGAIASASGFLSAPGETAEEHRRSAAEAEAWYASITAEMFG